MTLQQRTITAAFDEAAASYEAAVTAWEVASDSLRDAQARHRVATERVEDSLANLRLDPAYEGKNAEERAARLRLIASESADHREATAALEAERVEVQRWGDEATAIRDRMALHKRQLDWGIAQVNYHAVKGGENRETNDNRR